jgi:glycosyltransferase involved in cell wall biosynthesis
VLYLAPWVDVGGSDKGTIDWFRFLDRDRFRPSLITTQPSDNRRLAEIIPYADEVWELPQIMAGNDFPRFILEFIHTRRPAIVHIMNARLGFELLPEIARLSPRPAVVVQLHVEEADRSGYVRYVCTRYGTLVDAFSVSSHSLAERLDAYEVPRGKRRMIRTGVDGEHEFSPARVTAADVAGDRFQILYPARLTEQKDPFLMLDVAGRLRAAGVAFQIHVVGDGRLAEPLRRRVLDERLAEHVIFRGDRPDMPAWYAACDAVLLTSAFEGVPYVAFEAMAMATPLVAPALPGLVEIVSPDTGVLITPRDDAAAYVAALRDLAADPARRRRLGERGRERALAELSLTQMAAEHGALYDELLADRPAPDTSPAQAPSPIALRERPLGAAALVSVIVPCFNHGRYLEECLRSIGEQDHWPVEVIVVDDASTDPETLDALDRVEAEGSAEVVRLATNRGPSAARNAALERARGRYILPVDADNLLLPGAITALVRQLANAGEEVGYIFPNYRFFGNRTDRVRSPSFNLHALLSANYCDTSSLIDRRLLDHGFRYPDDILLGHEDWDLLLSLAERGIRGEPADADTLLYRKYAFTRSDLVDAGPGFGQVVAERHPALFDPAARAVIKGEWSPSITVAALDPLPEGSDDALSNLVASAARQSCQDFELIIRTGGEFWPTPLGRRLRRVPTASAATRGDALAQAVESSRGRWILAAYGSPAELLADPALIEKLIRVLASDTTDAIALAAAASACPPFRLLESGRAAEAIISAMVWPMTGRCAPPATLALPVNRPLELVVRWLAGHARLQCRHLPRRAPGVVDPEQSGSTAPLGSPRLARRRDALFRTTEPVWPPLPSASPNLAPGANWTPPLSRLLCRHRDPASGAYALTNHPRAPDGHQLDRILGTVRAVPMSGTLALHRTTATVPVALGDASDLSAPDLLGFVEQAPLPLWDALRLVRIPRTGQITLAAGDDDPLTSESEPLMTVGFIEAHPVHPHAAPHVPPALGVIGLVRTVDPAARRHRYGAGRMPAGQPAGELGALLTVPVGDCEPVWIDPDGQIATRALPTRDRRPSPRDALRWATEPLSWTGVGPAAPRARAAARRTIDAALACVDPRRRAARAGAPAGYLSRVPDGRTVPLYGAVHPVTGDQLLSTRRADLDDTGYTDGVLLGHLGASAPLTGRLGPVRLAIPWARHFGR